ncbi:ABC transporter ATP-binding protein/permease [Dermabacter sp. p3-SID358]|uniref:ABC transporter ATP-binding protein n=1 Tax=Dermabacter sp. p3-SID358 TaxID=2916114 RepID=UPI0021A3BF15|nr:ABC transporter ATP-binding protein [Dermabacter sp. p3-SID358]MCT1867159.1 ABC transporter ATP-binding protein/permease [Dermabacter sp. p3-SID358]
MSSSSLTRKATNESSLSIIKRGFSITPEIKNGLWFTILLAVLATVGKIVVPIAVQSVIDDGILAKGEPDFGLIGLISGVSILVLTLTMIANIWMNRRLFRASETALAVLRTRAFRHIHDLSLLTQGTEKRGSLVSRVTSDIDTVAQFISFGGITLVIQALQLVLATAVMLVYSPVLCLLVWICYLPALFLIRTLTAMIRTRFQRIRARTGDMLGTISESLVGAATLRAYGVQERSEKKSLKAVRDVRDASFAVQTPQAGTMVLSEMGDGITTAAVIVAGIYLGTGFDILTAGQLVAFLFLISLFSAPVRMLIEMLNEAQNAVAGWGRVLGVLDTPADVADPGGKIDPFTGERTAPVEGARPIPAGPIGFTVRNVRYTYPNGPEVLHGLTLDIPARSHVAIVGETGSGKTTFVKLLTRMMDPTSGEIFAGGVPVHKVPFSSLRSRVVLVPQEGFLFDSTVRHNLAFGRPDATDADIERALDELGHGHWLETLPAGLDTSVGQRGEALSAGERQLVSLARAYLMDPDVIVLDEATSAVDPAADVRLQAAIEGLSRGRTTITIAHRLSTAERADSIIVLDKGRLAEHGTHDEIVGLENGIYARLHHSWVAHRNAKR